MATATKMSVVNASSLSPSIYLFISAFHSPFMCLFTSYFLVYNSIPSTLRKIRPLQVARAVLSFERERERERETEREREELKTTSYVYDPIYLFLALHAARVRARVLAYI